LLHEPRFLGAGGKAVLVRKDVGLQVLGAGVARGGVEGERLAADGDE
jgi:hypothetical protein